MRHLVFLLTGLLSVNALASETLNLKAVAPGVYVHQASQHWPDRHNHGEIANIGFIVGDDCVAVIDSGGSPAQGQALKQAIGHITHTPICYVINTHVHPDHIYGNRAFVAPRVQFIGHHKLARAMATRGDHYLGRAAELLDIRVDQHDIVPPTLSVKQSMTLPLGNRDLLLTAHPTAHTDNDLSIYDSKTDTLWLADLLFLEHAPVLDGSIKGWLATLTALEGNHYQRVIPGHGPVVNNWPAALQPQKQYLQGLVDSIRPLIKQGKTLEYAVANVPVTGQYPWQLLDQFHRKNITQAFAELEWED